MRYTGLRGWVLFGAALLSLAALALVMCVAGCSYAPVDVGTLKPQTPEPTVTTTSPAPAIAATSVTIGKGLSGLQDVFNTLGGYLDAAYKQLPTSRELAMARTLVAQQSGTLTALQNENDSLRKQAALVDAITLERDQWKARAQEDDKLLAKAATDLKAAQDEAAAQKNPAGQRYMTRADSAALLGIEEDVSSFTWVQSGNS